MNKALMSIFTSLWPFSTSDFAQVRELPAPAGRGSGQPNLAVAPDGRVYLSWIERLGEGRFSCIYTERFDIIITQHLRESLTFGLTLVTVSVPQDASFVRVRAQRKKSNVC
jgi:hypothetical protein